MLGSRGGAGAPSDNFNQDQPAAAESSGPAGAKKAGNAAVAGDFDDDIPF